MTLACLLASTLISPSASAACSSLVFADGFETGDTSRWSGSLDPDKGSGTWVFDLDFGGTVRPFVLELLERQNGTLIGYLMGGTEDRVLVSGNVVGTTLDFELELVNPSTVRSVSFTGTLADDTIVGTASGDLTTQSLTLRRFPCGMQEWQLVFAQDAGGPEPLHVRRAAVVVDDDGAYVSGSWVGEDDCDLWGCDGGLSSFEEIGDTLQIGLETDGGCSDGSSLVATYDGASQIFSGTFTFHSCDGTTNGDVLVAYGMGAHRDDVRDALIALGGLADGLQSGLPFSGPLPGVRSDYLHFGKTEPALRGGLDDEMDLYADITADLTRLRLVQTAPNPRILPDAFVTDPLVAVDWVRIGTPTFLGAGATPVRYMDTRARPIIDDFKRLGLDSDRWKIAGNQSPALDLPWLYSIPPGGSRLVAPTADSEPVYVAIGPYGAHFLPLTGDPSGEAKANFVGFLAADDSEMEELEGNGNGVREEGEVWGYPVGGDLTGDRVRDRRPVYIAPLDAVVGSVTYFAGPGGNYFDDEPHWGVLLGFASDARFAIGHLGKIATELHDLVLATTGIDTDTFNGPPGTDLLSGFDPIPVGMGTELAFPQIFADPVPGHPGYYIGGGSFLDYPWAQMELSVPFGLDNSPELSADFCVYRFMTDTRRDDLQALMTLDMLDSESLRYRDRLFYDRWQWTAQGSLCQAESLLPRDFSSLYTSFGGWFERAEAGTTADELFSFIPIDRTAGAYDVSNYDSAAVGSLVLRSNDPPPFLWTMPDATTANAFLPTGEVLEDDGAAMLIKWRDLNATNAIVYQRFAYLLDANGLKIHWGNFSATPGGAVLPSLSPGDPCDDTTTLCYDHSGGAWPPHRSASRQRR